MLSSDVPQVLRPCSLGREKGGSTDWDMPWEASEVLLLCSTAPDVGVSIAGIAFVSDLNLLCSGPLIGGMGAAGLTEFTPM